MKKSIILGVMLLTLCTVVLGVQASSALTKEESTPRVATELVYDSTDQYFWQTKHYCSGYYNKEIGGNNIYPGSVQSTWSGVSTYPVTWYTTSVRCKCTEFGQTSTLYLPS